MHAGRFVSRSKMAHPRWTDARPCRYAAIRETGTLAPLVNALVNVVLAAGLELRRVCGLIAYWIEQALNKPEVASGRALMPGPFAALHHFAVDAGEQLVVAFWIECRGDAILLRLALLWLVGRM